MDASTEYSCYIVVVVTSFAPGSQHSTHPFGSSETLAGVTDIDAFVGEDSEFRLSGFRNAGEFGEMNEPRRFALLVEERRPPNGTGDDDVGLVDVPGDPSPLCGEAINDG